LHQELWATENNGSGLYFWVFGLEQKVFLASSAIFLLVFVSIKTNALKQTG
jgi:hypothetical protein